MTKIFISYVREDRDRVAWLAERLGHGGFEVWFDQNLKSGRAWWDEILSQIREADAFLYAMGAETAGSAACAAECAYAQALQTPVLPLRLSETVSPNLLPPGLSGVHLFDLFEEEDGLVLGLVGSLNTLTPRGPLPTPLPPEPEIPLSYLARWAEILQKDTVLDEAMQLKAVAELRRGLKLDEDKADALNLLKTLRDRPDTLAAIASDIDEFIAPPPPPPPEATPTKTEKIYTTPPGAARAPTQTEIIEAMKQHEADKKAQEAIGAVIGFVILIILALIFAPALLS